MAEQGREVAGRFALAELPRLAPLLTEPTGNVSFSLEFATDAQRRAVIRGRVEARLPLLCQRCLEEMVVDVHSTCVLVAVSGLDEAERLPEEYDSLLVEDDRVSVRDIVEDELLLAVPAVPRHTPACTALHAVARGENRQPGASAAGPFEVLARLRERTGKN